MACGQEIRLLHYKSPTWSVESAVLSRDCSLALWLVFTGEEERLRAVRRGVLNSGSVAERTLDMLKTRDGLNCLAPAFA